jgi:hypothetical protein
MIWKNYLVFSRNLKLTLFQLFTPIFICLLLVLIQFLVDNWNKDFVDKNPSPIPLDNIKKCEYPQDCTTIGYGIIVKFN